MSRASHRAAAQVIVYTGQSLNLVGGYTTACMTEAGLGQQYKHQGAITGEDWPLLLTLEPYQSFRRFTTALDSVNMMNGGQSALQGGATGAQTYARFLAYAQAATAAGVGSNLVITIPKSTVFDAGEETQRQAANTLLLANGDGAWDAVVDVAAIAELQDPSDTLYFSDGLHWTSTGAGLAAELVGPVLAGLL